MDNYESPSEVLKKKQNGQIVENEKPVEPLNEDTKSKLKFIDIFNENNDTDKNEEINTFLKQKKVIKKRKDKKKGIPFFDDNYTNIDMPDLDFSFGNTNLKINDNILNDDYKTKNDMYDDSLYDNYNNKVSYLVSEVYRLKSELEESSQKECKKNEENKILLEKNNILSDSIDSMKKDIEKLKNIYEEETLRIKESYDRRLEVLKSELTEKDDYLKKKILDCENEANNKITDHENKYLNEKKKNDELATSLENVTKEKEDIVRQYTCEIANHKREQDKYKSEMEKWKDEAEKYKKEMEYYKKEAENYKNETDKYKKEMEHYKNETDKWKTETEKSKDEMNQRIEKMNEINEEIKRIENILTEEKKTNEKLQTIIENSEKDITNLNNAINQKNETIKTMVNDILLVKNVYEELVKEKEENEISKQKLVKEIKEYEKKITYLKSSVEEYNENNQKLVKCNQKLNENIRKKEKEITALQNENIYLKRENVVFNQNFLNSKSCKSGQINECSSDSTNSCKQNEKHMNKYQDNDFEVGKKKKIHKKTKNKKKICIKEKEDISTDTNGETESDDEKIEYNIEICDESEKDENLNEQTKVGIIKDTTKSIELVKEEKDKIQNIGGNNFIVPKNNSNKIGSEKLLSYKQLNMNIFDSKKNENNHFINDKGKKISSNIAIDQSDYNNDILHIEYSSPVNLKKKIKEQLKHSLMQTNKIQLFDITSNLVNIDNLSNALERKTKSNFIKRDIHDKLGIFYDESNDDIPYQESEEEDENNNNKKEIWMNNTKKGYLNLKTNSLLDNTLSGNFSNKQLNSSFLDKKMNNPFINKEFGSNKYLYDLNLYKLKKCNIISYNNSIIPIKRTKKNNLMRSIMDSNKTYIDSINKLNADKNYLNKYNERNEMNNSSLKWSDTNTVSNINQLHDDQGEVIIQPINLQTIENVKGDNKAIDYFLSHIQNNKLNNSILLMEKGNKAITKIPNSQLYFSNKSNKQQKKEKTKSQDENKINEHNNEDTHAISSFLNKMENINDDPNDKISNNFVIKKDFKNLISDDKYADVNNQKSIRSYLLSKYKKKSNVYGLFIINERLKNIYKNIENKKKSISNFPINMCNIEDMKKFSNSFSIIQNESQEYFENTNPVKNSENQNFNNKKDEDEKSIVYPNIEENKLLLEIPETQKEEIIGVQLSDDDDAKSHIKDGDNNSDDENDNICAVINYEHPQDTLQEVVTQINKNKNSEICDDYNDSIETYACDSEHTQIFDYKEKEKGERTIKSKNFEENNDLIYMNGSGENRLKIISCSEKNDEKEKNIINNDENEPSKKLSDLFSKHVNISEHMRKLPVLYSSKILKKGNHNISLNGNNKKKKNNERNINRDDCFKNDFKLDESQDEYYELLDSRNGYGNIFENLNESKIILRNGKKDKKYKDYLNKIKADMIENKDEIFDDQKIVKHHEKDTFNINDTLNTSFNHFLLSYKLNRRGLENSNSGYNNNEHDNNSNTIFDIIKSEKLNKIKKKQTILALHNEISNNVIKNKPQNIQFDHYYNKLKILRDKNQRLKNDRDLSSENYEKSNLSTQNILLPTSQISSALHNKSERSGKTFNNIYDKKTSESFLFNSNPLNNNSANNHRDHQNNFMVRKK
ncbi:conserved Plasmodium protein, unknown function [Plasmodium vinckei vinckei]|uniref:Uncharacterized protein n=1 Tax=Plasmodium vinckei vinckei TaxID=54757 RepID=A0A449BZ12_PLAVN|nr:conserved Plasmodium protein, unknown function [Plasmodium vinckei vinckei]VEV58621.1 conserved Plasmodium protein, unknown function [Plasmodium vinckei vinckei]